MGPCEAGALASVEGTVKYHPCVTSFLTGYREPEPEQCQVGSLTGAVASNGALWRQRQRPILAVCWELRLLKRQSLSTDDEGVQNPALLAQR